MANIISDSLFLLVKSLKKSEKRYFKIFTTRLGGINEKKFIRLFDSIDKQNVYDERQLLKKAKWLTKGQLSNLKAHLQRQILLSLKLYNSAHQADIQIRNLIDFAQILYNKGLYNECVKMLDKARKLATANDRSIQLLDIIELEKMAIMHTVSEHNDERVNKIIAETQAVATSIQNINIFSNLAVKLNSYYVKIGFIRNSSDYQNVNNFFQSSLPVYEEKNLSFQEKLYLYYSFVSYYFFIQDFKNGYKYAKKWVLLFNTHPEMIAHKLELYLKGINHLLVAQNKLLLVADFNETYKQLMKVPFLEVHITENIQMLHFKYKYMHKINYYFMTGDFTGGSKIISVVEHELDSFTLHMDKHYVLVFYYKVACLYFGASNFKKAIFWLNKIINSKDVDLREDIHTFARILNLISHYELDNIEQVEYYLKSTYRFLLKKEGLYKYQKYILQFMKNLSKETQGEQLIKQFEGLELKLLPLEKQRYEKRPFLYFDIISWLQSKITHEPIEMVIRKRIRKSIKQ